MQVQDCFLLGHIGRAHGIKGEVKASFSAVDFIEDYEDKASIYVLQNGRLTLLYLKKFNIINDTQAILAFKDITDRNAAEALTGSGIYLPLTELPELEEGQFYYHEIIGYKIVDEGRGEIGKVIEVQEMPAQDLIKTRFKGWEVLFPITDEFVGEADHEEKILHVDLPPGLIEVYLPEP